MKVLITGATGLIGKSIGKNLVEQGHAVVVVSRDPERARLELPFPAKILAWSGGSDPLPAGALEDVEAVLHLAGEPIAEGRWTAAKKKRIRESRVEGTLAVVRSIQSDPSAARRLKTFVMGSAIGYYGGRAGRDEEDAVDESTEPGDDFLAKVCVDWEKAGLTLKDDARFADVRFVAVRTGIVLDRQGGALAKLLPIFSRGLGGKLGNGRQWMSWIHVEDISNLFLFALENPAVKGPIDGTAPHPTRNETFSNSLAKAVGRGLFLPVPETALKAAVGELAETLLTGAKVSAKKALDLGFRFKYPDLSEALVELCRPERERDHELYSEQWIPRPLDEVFRFFSDEKNLETITPPFLKFSVLGKSTPHIQKGTLIDYRLSLHGIPLKWKTEISEWNPPNGFVDRQLKGPYTKWEHVHEMKPFAGGVLVSDRVRYRLPLGLFGDAAAGWKVGGDVRAIFNYRRKVIGELLR